MTPGEAVPILARWISELQTDLDTAHDRIRQLEDERSKLEHRVSGFTFWMKTGHKPAQIRDLARYL